MTQKSKVSSIIWQDIRLKVQGTVMQGTGGIRKFRWASGNRGKSSGVRIIYYFHSETIPLFLLTAFGKNEKANLSKAERNELAKFVNLLAKNYGENNV